MTTNCYAMVRGSVIRITRLDRRGAVLEGDRSSLVSRNVTRVSINEVNDSRPGLSEKNDRDTLRLYTPDQAQTVRYTADIDLTLTDPDAIELTTGQPVIMNGAGEIVGFDVRTRVPAQPFALEVWSKIAGAQCGPSGVQYGYTLFPFLKGGYLSGLTFSNGAVTFSIKNAKTQRGAKWELGPYKPRLATMVERNKHWTNFLVDSAPEAKTGAQPLYDVIDNFYADPATQTADVIDNFYADPASQTADILYGGTA